MVMAIATIQFQIFLMYFRKLKQEDFELEGGLEYNKTFFKKKIQINKNPWNWTHKILAPHHPYISPWNQSHYHVSKNLTILGTS